MSPAEGSARAGNGVSPGKLHIPSLSHALLAGSKPRVGLTFTGAAGWRSSAVDGGLGHLGPTPLPVVTPNPGDKPLHRLDELSPTRLVCLEEASAGQAVAVRGACNLLFLPALAASNS